MDESEVLHAVDRTLTDLLPDKHQYEADLQLYLDYSLPAHPEVPSMEEEHFSQDYGDADLADDVVLQRDWPDGMGDLEQQSLYECDRQLAVSTEYSVEECVFASQITRSATDVWPETPASEIDDNADDSQALRDVSAAHEHLHSANEARDEQPRGKAAVTPGDIPQAGVHESFSQADGAAGDSNDPAIEDSSCADSGSMLTEKEGRAPEHTDSEAELLQDQSAVVTEESKASLAHNAEPIAGRTRAPHMPHRGTCSKVMDVPHSQTMRPGGSWRKS